MRLPALSPARPPRRQRPVHVVGTGRCGSTLLSDILRAHPDLLSVSEVLAMLTPDVFPDGPLAGPAFWQHLSAPRGWATFLLRHGIGLDEFLYRPGPGARFSAETGVPPILMVALPHISDDPERLHDELREYVLTLDDKPIGSQYRRVFDWLRDRFRKKLWVERSGGSFTFLPLLMLNFPNGRYIHLYRDGRDCALSMSRMHAYRLTMLGSHFRLNYGFEPYGRLAPVPEGVEVPEELRPLLPASFDPGFFREVELPLEWFAALWSSQVANGLPFLAALDPDRVLHLRYENLVRAPGPELLNLARFLRLDPRHDAEWLARAAPLAQPRPSSWRDLPRSRREALEKGCRPGLDRLYGGDLKLPRSDEIGARAAR